MMKPTGIASQPLPKAATGIEGFDELSGGGLLRYRTTLLIGGLGAGKTVFALQCVVQPHVKSCLLRRRSMRTEGAQIKALQLRSAGPPARSNGNGAARHGRRV